MTDFEKFISQTLSTITFYKMGGDWTNKLEIVRKVNCYSLDAKIYAHYNPDINETLITVKGV